MTQFNAPPYEIERPTGRCAVTGRELRSGEPYVAALVEAPPDPVADSPSPQPSSAGPRPGGTGLGMHRIDVSLEAWERGPRPAHVFSHWRSRVPEPHQKRRLFVDDDVLVNLFRRLSDASQPERLAFRFVLALILMRKRLLKYEGSVPAAGLPELPVRDPASAEPVAAGGGADSTPTPEVWRMTLKGDADTHRVVNPRLDEAQIQQVTQQLGEVLEADV